MNRPVVQLVSALLALTAAAAVAIVTAVGVVGLIVGLVWTEPMTQGRVVSASLVVTGAALVLVAHVRDPHALRRALDRSRWIASCLAEIVASAGRL